MARHGEGSVSIDPICGKPVVEREADSFDYKRKTYYFCSPRCRARFELQAERIRVGELARIGALFAKKKARWGVA
jgi:YHS domain-containing protein